MKTCFMACAFVFFISLNVHAQSGFVTTGDNFSNSNGSVSLSVGQLFFQTNDDTNYQVTEGLQQAYEISSSGINPHFLNLKLDVFPNPATDNLCLKMDATQYLLSYKFYDALGKLLQSGIVNKGNNILYVTTLPKGVYYLQIVQKNKIIKNYKIIKK